MLADAKQQLEELSSRQKVLAEAIDPKQQTTLLDFYVRIAPRLLNAERCSIFIHDPQNKKVWLKTGTGVTERGIEVSVKDSVVGEVITTGKPVIARDLESRDGTHKKVDTTTGFVSREIICVYPQQRRQPDHRCDPGAQQERRRWIWRRGSGVPGGDGKPLPEHRGKHLSRSAGTRRGQERSRQRQPRDHRSHRYYRRDLPHRV